MLIRNRTLAFLTGTCLVSVIAVSALHAQALQGFGDEAVPSAVPAAPLMPAPVPVPSAIQSPSAAGDVVSPVRTNEPSRTFVPEARDPAPAAADASRTRPQEAMTDRAPVPTTDDRAAPGAREPAGPAMPKKVVTHLPDTLRVSIDRTKLVPVPDRVRTIMLGNPLVADFVVQRSGVAVLTGKAPGSTNLLALDQEGQVVADVEIEVVGPDDRRHVTVIQAGKQPTQQTYLCLHDRCEAIASVADPTAVYQDIAQRYQRYGTDMRAAASAAPGTVSIEAPSAPQPRRQGEVVPMVANEPLAGQPARPFPNSPVAAARPAAPGQAGQPAAPRPTPAQPRPAPASVPSAVR